MVNSINYDQRCTALFWKMLKIINADQRWSAMISVDSALKTFLQCRLFKSDIYQCSNNGRKTVPLIKFDHCNDQICSKCQIFVFHENAESTLMQRWWNQRCCNADFQNCLLHRFFHEKRQSALINDENDSSNSLSCFRTFGIVMSNDQRCQRWSNLIKFYHRWSNFIIADQILSSLIKFCHRL